MRGLALSIVLLGCSGSGQTMACARYLTCSEAVEPGSRARLEGTYGVSGRCWQNDGIAKDCDSLNARRNLLEQFKPFCAETVFI